MAEARFCLLTIDHWSTCMTKAEWSGWMQAVGSLLALAVAVGTIWYQGNEQRRGATSAVRTFARQLSLWLEEQAQRCRTQEEERIRVSGRVLGAIVSSVAGISIDRLTSAQIEYLLRCRQIAAEAEERAAFLRQRIDTLAPNWQHEAKVFDDLRTRLSFDLDALI